MVRPRIRWVALAAAVMATFLVGGSATAGTLPGGSSTTGALAAGTPDALAGRGPLAAPARATTVAPAAPTGPVTMVEPVQDCPTGERQRDAEYWLGQLVEYGPITVDGVLTAAECAGVQRFQRRFGISPANGRAGATTADVARRIAVSQSPVEQAACRPGSGLTVCVNLSLQTLWVVRDGTVMISPTVIRTGMRGFATPAGSYRTHERSLRNWSDPYEVWLPYWQRIVRGIGFHETTTYIHNSGLGSHGCVNLLKADAKALWSLTPLGTSVRIFGRRPLT